MHPPCRGGSKSLGVTIVWPGRSLLGWSAAIGLSPARWDGFALAGGGLGRTAEVGQHRPRKSPSLSRGRSAFRFAPCRHASSPTA